MTLDWADIALHAGGAVLFFANGTFWIRREIRQHPDNPWVLFTRPQVFLEWFVPSIVVPLVLYLTAWQLGYVK